MHTAATTLPGTPRVLQASDGRAPIRRREDKRISRTERERIARGEGDAIALSPDPADWVKLSDRVRFRKLVHVVIAVRGNDAPAWAKEAAEAFKLPRTGYGEAANANRERLLSARRALNDETQARVAQGVARRELYKELRERLARERRETNVQALTQLIIDNPMPALARRGMSEAVRTYAADLVAKARAGGIRAHDIGDDPHLAHLRTAGEVARPGSSTDQIHQFITDDFFLRHGDGDLIRTNRQVNQDALKWG
ncbi:hypothetical protein ASG32_26150 [Methylobacterium sp. Leaf361]|uniref:hypothetical protein n=1 Tax=Methylobacterium sp. Leaf361 TaxID=1736352 RepID=UPI0006F63290|nr:hypothetical protein [Methylobacterium sp. Leaf361]KQS78051.1 hypothetical protein ASG32_26150 [Methylobacterium sp. Leaf361]